MVALGFGLVAPALPLFAREFGVGNAAAGAVVSAFALMRLVMAPFVGRLVNAVGERVLLAAGIGVVAGSHGPPRPPPAPSQAPGPRGARGGGPVLFRAGGARPPVPGPPRPLRA